MMSDCARSGHSGVPGSRAVWIATSLTGAACVVGRAVHYEVTGCLSEGAETETEGGAMPLPEVEHHL